MKPDIGISNKHINKNVDILSSLLANEMILYVKTRKFHWNVSGESFMELHKLFEGQYNQLEESIDEIAERCFLAAWSPAFIYPHCSEIETIKHTATHCGLCVDCIQLFSRPPYYVVQRYSFLLKSRYVIYKGKKYENRK